MGQEKELSQFTKHEYGELLILLRQHVDKTQQEIADDLEAPLSTYRKWEQGLRKPRPYYRRKIRDTFEEALYALGALKRERDPESDQVALPPTTPDQDFPPSTVPLVEESPPFLVPSEHEEDIDIVDPCSEVLNHLSPSIASDLMLEGRGTVTVEMQFPRTQALLTSDLTMRLQAVAELPFRGYHPVYQAFVRALKEFDSMAIISLNHSINRREALSRVMGFPFTAVAFTTVEQGGRFPPAHAIEGLLSRCATGIVACREIYSTCDTSNMPLALESVARYIAVLTTIAQQSSQHREDALELATRSAILRVLLALECLSSSTAIPYALEAVNLSQETTSVPLQLTALNRLAYTYFQSKQPSLFPLAIPPAEKSAALLERVKSKTFLPPSLIVGNYSVRSIIQAINHLEVGVALGNATEIDLGTPTGIFEHDPFFTQVTPVGRVTDAGLALYHSGNPQAALQWFAKRVDPETLEAKTIQGVRTSERGRINTLNAMIPAALKTSDRDKQQIIAWWKAAIEGAKLLRSEQLFNDALIASEALEYAWPGDKEIRELRVLKQHWNVEEKQEG